MNSSNINVQKNAKSIGIMRTLSIRFSKLLTGMMTGSVTIYKNSAIDEFCICGNQENIALANIINSKMRISDTIMLISK